MCRLLQLLARCSGLVHTVLQAPARTAASEGNVNVVSARGLADSLQATPASEVLPPQELPETELGKHANPANTLSDPLKDAHATAAATNESTPISVLSPVVAAHSPATALSASPQQQLPSPASKVATKPFSSLPPAALAQQWKQQPQVRQAQNHQPGHLAAAAAPTVGLLELSLSAEQIALLQAAADNAQSYLDRDAAEAGISTGQVHSATPGEGDASPPEFRSLKLLIQWGRAATETYGT